MLVDLSEERSRQVAGELNNERVVWCVTDVTHADQVRCAVDSTIAKWGDMDVLFNNAENYGPLVPTIDYPEDKFHSIIAMHERSGGKRGRGSPGKTPFVAAVETMADGKPNRVKLVRVRRFTKKNVKRVVGQIVKRGSRVVIDGLGCFNGVAEAGYTHQAIVSGSGRRLAEFAWRFNRRYDLPAMIPRLGWICARTPRCRIAC